MRPAAEAEGWTPGVAPGPHGQEASLPRRPSVAWLPLASASLGWEQVVSFSVWLSLHPTGGTESVQDSEREVSHLPSGREQRPAGE